MEQKDFSVAPPGLKWDAVWEEHLSGALLPTMRMDVLLRSRERTIVMEAKYTPNTLQYYRGTRKVRSEHLFQLFAYLKNLEQNGGRDARAEGILIYPRAGEKLDLHYTIQGHRVQVYTLDLLQDWRTIHADLLQLLAA